MRQSRQVTSWYCPGTSFLNCPIFLLYILIEDHVFYLMVCLAKLNSHDFLSISIPASDLSGLPHALFVKYTYIIIINIYRKYQVIFKYIFSLCCMFTVFVWGCPGQWDSPTSRDRPTPSSINLNKKYYHFSYFLIILHQLVRTQYS